MERGIAFHTRPFQQKTIILMDEKTKTQANKDAPSKSELDTKTRSWIMYRKQTTQLQNGCDADLEVWMQALEIGGETHIKKMQSLHYTALRRIVGGPWYKRNINIQRITRMLDVATITRQQNDGHLLKLESHENSLVFGLTRGIPIKRLKRWHVTELGSRINL